ncbi:hypothetical protein IEQ34_010821 [Dendrobium chrysotoxum]|uniref:Uncharacterized protein n=1 Tax=Dendrobium chrysotoxum TaxID=161865 RepID=A0AAV7GWV3_DENCH|nr:hypothetical protein IEQ34_010821 [Dendrobium chrysotoxum]
MKLILVMATEEMEESSYFTKVLGLLRADVSRYQHVWPPMKFRWQIVVGSMIGFFGAALGSVGGVGGGRDFLVNPPGVSPVRGKTKRLPSPPRHVGASGRCS